MRLVARGLRFVILAAFAAFFVVPVIWLILAPTKSDEALVSRGPFAFGSLHNVALAWEHLDAIARMARPGEGRSRNGGRGPVPVAEGTAG